MPGNYGPRPEGAEANIITEVNVRQLVDNPTLTVGIITESGSHYLLRASEDGSTIIVKRREKLEGEKRGGFIIVDKRAPQFLKIGESIVITETRPGKRPHEITSTPIKEIRFVSVTE